MMKRLCFAVLVLLCSCEQEQGISYEKLGDEAPQLEIYHENTAADLKEKQELFYER